jgi:maltose alpha-D-glucosyltransferase/alpha-amylase
MTGEPGSDSSSAVNSSMRSRFPKIGELPYLLTLAPRGFYWFQLTEDPDD